MATVEYMHICDYAFQSQNGKPGIIGIFDRIGASAFPATHGYMSVAAQLRGTAHEKIPFALTLEKPSGEVLQKIDGTVLAGDEGGAFVCANLINLVFPTDGRYVVKISSGGKTLNAQSLHLKKSQVSQIQPSFAGPTH